ncbi:MAG TPA: MBL fold metallo-hydrolase [Candidatus Binatia bacterium]|jgi:L-ascorbate metabolism protein UlaG (beta-lactamase superfamily)|nr:MBL fold metallo-hydrolase [Candidatus Binatia bacterium]
MIQPAQSHAALLADIHASNRRDGRFRLWWLGQSGFLLQWQGIHILLDPYLSDSLTRKYSHTDKPHVRMTELVIDPAELSFVDVVSSSHNHTDHLDAETLGPILTRNRAVKFIIPEANRAFVADRLRIDPTIPVGLDDGNKVELSIGTSSIRISGVASAHEEVEHDEQGRVKHLGYVLQFGDWSLYHSGDTLRYHGMAEKLRPFAVDIALLPINGRSPERRVAGNLSGTEAAKLAHDIGAKLVIPCHFDMFEFNTAPPDEFVATCRNLGQAFRILRCGERFDSEG